MNTNTGMLFGTGLGAHVVPVTDTGRADGTPTGRFNIHIGGYGGATVNNLEFAERLAVEGELMLLRGMKADDAARAVATLADSGRPIEALPSA